MRRQDYIELVENQYFGNVSAGDIDAVCACFTADSTITILHGDNPDTGGTAAGKPTGYPPACSWDDRP